VEYLQAKHIQLASLKATWAMESLDAQLTAIQIKAWYSKKSERTAQSWDFTPRSRRSIQDFNSPVNVNRWAVIWICDEFRPDYCYSFQING
jgi:hypothetical protein